MSFFNQGKKPFGIGKIIGLFFIFVLIVLVVGWVVMYLWNAILPSAAHFGTINYWQAVGLLILCRILFGGFGGGRGNRPHMGRKGNFWRDKWLNMSEEERQSFKEQWQKRCKPND